MHRPEDESDKDEKERKRDGEKGAHPVEDGNRGVRAFDHLEMWNWTFKAPRMASGFVCVVYFGSRNLPQFDRSPVLQRSPLVLFSSWCSAQKAGEAECCPGSSVREQYKV